MSHRTRIVLPLAGLLALVAGTAARQPVPPEVVDGWRNYTALFSHASGDYTATSTMRQGQESSGQEAQVAFAFTSRCKRVEVVETVTGRAKPSKRVIYSNPKYAFRLDPGKNGWLWREVVLVGDEPSKALGVLHDQVDAWLSGVHCLASVQRTRLLELTDDLRRIEPRPGQPPTFVLDKERNLKEGPNTITYHKLSLQLDADHDHTVRTVKADMLMNRSAGTLEISVTQQTIAGTPVPVQSVVREVYPAASGDMEIATDTAFRIDPTVELPDQEFTLTAYGLPEPVGITWSKPTPRYLWFLVAAGVFIAIAVGFRFLARRRAARLAS